MKLLLSRLLAILAIAGLLVTPLAPAVAGKMAVESTVSMADMVSMAEGMPCCPHQKQSLPDCQQNCPFAALCTAQCIPTIPTEAIFVLRSPVQAEPLYPYDDVPRDQRSIAPPRRPPRI
jgi:hypothetical protein